MEINILFSRGIRKDYYNIEEIRFLERTAVLWSPDTNKHYFIPLVNVFRIDVEDGEPANEQGTIWRSVGKENNEEKEGL